MATAEDTSAAAQSLPSNVDDMLDEIMCALENIGCHLNVVHRFLGEPQKDSKEAQAQGALNILFPYIEALSERAYQFQCSYDFQIELKKEGDDNE